MTIKQFAHRLPCVPEDHIRREGGRQADKVFMGGVEDPTVKIQLLLGGE
jgi:hypothetical protein